MPRSAQPRILAPLLPWALLLAACSSSEEPEPTAPLGPHLLVVTFNSGTTPGLGHDAPPDDGYGSEQADISDLHYGDGLAFNAVIEDTRTFFAELSPDIVAFQEIFHTDECANIPAVGHPGFVCDGWQPGDPSVVQRVLGDEYQVACHLGKSDKCLAVRRSLGTFAGCDADVCLDHLDGAQVMDCGGGSRVGRGVIELVEGGTLTVVNVHGSSGITQEDQDCRVQQFAQVFEDMGSGDGAPAANGERNIVLGDLNTDPGRNTDFDESAQKWVEHVGPGKAFQSISELGPEATPTYGSFFNIDHIASDAFSGSCQAAGISPDLGAVSDITYFDHKPIACILPLE